MPVVPTLPIGSDAGGQRVAQTATAGADSFGAVQGQEISQAGQAGVALGSGIASDAIYQQNMINRSTVRDALATYQEGANGYLQDNVLSKQGKDAIGLVPQTQQYLTQLREQTNQTLNPRQQAMFSTLAPMADRRVIMLQQRHEAQQTQVFQNQTLDHAISSDINMSISDPFNDAQRAEAEKTINADTSVKYPGDPAAASTAAAVQTNALYKGLADRISDADPAKASVFLSQNKDKFIPADFEDLNKSVQAKVISAAAAHVTSTLDPLDPNAQKAIAAIQDPETKALAQAQFNTHVSAAQSQQALDSANSDANNAQTVLSSPENAAMSMPKDLPPQQQAALLQAANDRIQATQGGRSIATDLNVYGNLVNQAANDPDGFIRRPLTPYLSSLSDSDWKNVMQLRSDLVKNRDTGEAQSANRLNQTFTQGIKGVPSLSTFDDSGKPMKPGPAMQQRVQQINDFRNDFQDRVKQQFPDPKDRTPENAQSVLDNMLVSKVVNKGWFSDTSIPQGLVDENPSLDTTTWKGPAVSSLTPYTAPNGTSGYLDKSSNTVYDRTGSVLGTLRPKNQ
jgi:hypothetical protein